GGFRPRIRGLEVTGGPAPRNRSLQGVVVGVSIVGENLHAVVPVDARVVGAGGAVGTGGGGDLERGAIVGDQIDGIGYRSDARFDVGAGFAEMNGVRAYVTHFEDPALAEGTLNGEVPLLGVRGDEL